MVRTTSVIDPYEHASVVNAKQRYYVAPIITKDRFDSYLHKLYHTLDKKEGKGAMSTRSNSKTRKRRCLEAEE